MVKRKAEISHGRGKAPARPARQPPPPPADDSSDSDVCEIISPPPSSSNPAGRRQLGQQPSAVMFPAAPGASHPFLPPQGHASVGLMSMMSGLPGGFQLPRPEQGAGFGLGLYQQQAFAQQMQASGGLNPLMYAPPQHLPPAAGFHGGYFAGSPMPLAAGASSGGASSGAVGEFSSVFENGDCCTAICSKAVYQRNISYI